MLNSNFIENNLEVRTFRTMDIQSTKIELMRLILGIENPHTINKISALVKNENSDFWNDLTITQRKEIEQAVKELDAGKGMEWNEFKSSIK